MEKHVETKAIKIKSFRPEAASLDRMVDYINEGSVIKVNNLFTKNLKIQIKAKPNSSLSQYAKSHIYIHFATLNSLTTNGGHFKQMPIDINHKEINYEICFPDDKMWGGSIPHPYIDHIVFESPIVGLEFEAVLYERN